MPFLTVLYSALPLILHHSFLALLVCRTVLDLHVRLAVFMCTNSIAPIDALFDSCRCCEGIID